MDDYAITVKCKQYIDDIIRYDVANDYHAEFYDSSDIDFDSVEYQDWLNKVAADFYDFVECEVGEMADKYIDATFPGGVLDPTKEPF